VEKDNFIVFTTEFTAFLFFLLFSVIYLSCDKLNGEEIIFGLLNILLLL